VDIGHRISVVAIMLTNAVTTATATAGFFFFSFLLAWRLLAAGVSALQGTGGVSLTTTGMMPILV